MRKTQEGYATKTQQISWLFTAGASSPINPKK